MKRKITTLIIALSCAVSIYAQDMKETNENSKIATFSMQSGIGYFTNLNGYFRGDLGALPGSEPGQPGSILWNEFMVNLKEKNSVGFYFGYGRVKFTAYNRFDDFIAPYRIDDIYTLVGINFYRNFKVNRSLLSFGIGPQFQVNKSPRVEYDKILVEEEGETFIIPYNFKVEYYDDGALGLGFDLNYLYNLNNYVSVGARVSTSFMMYYGIDGFMVSPFIKIGF
jgi:hypothetical protein